MRFKDDAITSIQPHQTTSDFTIGDVTTYWLYQKTPEELIEEIMEAEKKRVPILETV